MKACYTAWAREQFDALPIRKFNEVTKCESLDVAVSSLEVFGRVER